MPTKKFELRFKFEHLCGLWTKKITTSSGSWLITFDPSFGNEWSDFKIMYNPGNSSWKEAVITLCQHGKIILEIMFTNGFLDENRYHVRADSLRLFEVFHATITETNGSATGNAIASTLRGSSAGVSEDKLNSELTQTDAGAHDKPENNFDRPSALFNTVLVIGEKKVYVNKDFLAIFSLFFEKLFFGEFAEKGKSEVVLENIDYDKFVEFLRVIHPDGKAVTNTNVEDVLFVANYVQCTEALKKCSCFLLKDESFSVLEKLHIADKYELTALMDSILDEMTMDELQSVSREGKNEFSIPLKARIYDILFQ